MSERKTPYANVSLTLPAKQALQQAAVQLTPVVGGKVSMSEAVLILAHAVTALDDDKIRALAMIDGGTRPEDGPRSPRSDL